MNCPVASPEISFHCKHHTILDHLTEMFGETTFSRTLVRCWMPITIHNRYKSFILQFAVVWLVMSMASTVPGAGADRAQQSSETNLPDVTVTYNDVNRETTYGISSGMCTLHWISREAEPGVVLHREHCGIPLSRQMPLLSQIVSVFLKTGDNASFRTLFWGRLTPDGSLPDSQELSIRLVRAAHLSPNWDTRKGQPKKGDINGFIKNLANDRMIYSELKELFERYHKRLTISSVEKVLVSEAGKRGYFDRLKSDGILASDRLPFDCMVWFSVTER